MSSLISLVLLLNQRSGGTAQTYFSQGGEPESLGLFLPGVLVEVIANGEEVLQHGNK